MREIDDRVRPLLRPASSVKNSKEVTRIINRADLDRLNRAIAEQIEQNERERIASIEAAMRDTTLYR